MSDEQTKDGNVSRLYIEQCSYGRKFSIGVEIKLPSGLIRRIGISPRNMRGKARPDTCANVAKDLRKMAKLLDFASKQIKEGRL